MFKLVFKTSFRFCKWTALQLVEGVSINKQLQQIKQDEPLSLVKQALNYMAHKGFFHNDIQWRHLALMISDDQSQLLPIFIDLTDVSVKQIQNNNQKDQAYLRDFIEKQIIILKETLSDTCLMTIE
ncbi:Hypothetical_protein [Hexamita inflata]|uniref:Hypothetical_protein n=1 Tax=Hexamita inflata TaxID=28002 RepID=A0ABP1H764_9EUKA